MNAVGHSLGKVIGTKLTEWDFEKKSKSSEPNVEKDIEVDPIEEVFAPVDNEVVGDDFVDLSEAPNDDGTVAMDKKKVKRKYKQVIREVLGENGNKLKKKKLKKKVVQLSAEFDGNVDEDARGDMFEKYLVKVVKCCY